MEDRIITYGGQAVIEGVLMRGQKAFAIAMRAPDGKIVVHKDKLAGIYSSTLTKIPFLRGIIMLWDALGLGMRALTVSANVQTGEDEKLEGPALYITLGVSLLLGVGLFFLLPAAIGGWVEHLLTPALSGDGGVQPSLITPASSSGLWIGNLLEGVLRLILLVGYIWAIGFMPDVKRLFGYHGAEHKTINAFEAGAELTPESVAKFPLEHARCGTAFLLTLVLLSILVFTALGPLPILWRLVSRVLLIPVLAGIAVEYIRWTANHLKNPVVQWMIRPNLALQRLTTREPDMQMLEVAIESFNTMRQSEKEIAG
jgi:uncharacterized protein YqhQ